MLVVDVDALEAVNLLDAVEQVLLQLPLPEDLQDLVRVLRTVGEGVAGLDALPLLNVDVQPLGDGVLALLAVVGADDDLAGALDDLAVVDGTVDLRHDRGVLRVARLEQVHDARRPPVMSFVLVVARGIFASTSPSCSSSPS